MTELRVGLVRGSGSDAVDMSRLTEQLALAAAISAPK